MTIFLPALIGGIVLAIAGVAIVINAGRIGPAMQQQQRLISSDKFAKKSSTPRNVIIGGIMFMVFGVVLVVLSFLGLDW
ncbi:hypothetical protein [Curtobacterium sp. MCBD17_021]|uniref:hypothetical protein n=1 Tax=Curtobacterium sp. MCBD17_021 TaxID=2175665 RepID=UPI0011B442C7|nr:hypothetical protein [Curtobacterium sp. MCBD17_021]